MKLLQKICFVLLLMTTFSSVYGGSCWDDVPDVDDCRVKAKSGFFTKGNAGAQYNLGIMYDNGYGVLQDHKEAVKWWRKAAEQGHSSAQFNLGNMYNKGQGVLRDYKEAVKWYRKAAKQGLPQAQYNLGNMHQKGQGVLQDKVMAVMYYSIAAVSGFERAIKSRDELRYNMYPKKYEKSQELAREWMRMYE
jgi:TPR repeat protein